MKTAKELLPPEHNWIYPSRWLPGKRLLFHASSGFDVWGFFEYDVVKGVERELDHARASILIGTDFHREGSLVAYTNNSRVEGKYLDHLHIVELHSNTNNIVASRKSIVDPKISCDKRNVAFVEVEWYADRQSLDHLWIYNLKAGSLNELYTCPAKAKAGGVNELSWSFDDRYIGMFFSPEALVLEVQNPDNIHKVSGTDFGWIGNSRFVFAQGNSVYIYDLNTGERKLFLEDASSPSYLRTNIPITASKPCE